MMSQGQMNSGERQSWLIMQISWLVKLIGKIIFTDAVVVSSSISSISCYVLKILARVLDKATTAEILQCEVSETRQKPNTGVVIHRAILAFGLPKEDLEFEASLGGIGRPPKCSNWSPH